MRYLLVGAMGLSIIPFLVHAEDVAVAVPTATSTVANAAKLALVGMTGCGNMTEQVTITVNHNLKAASFAEAKKQFEEHVAKVNDYAKQQVKGKFQLQSENYNIYSQAAGYGADGTPLNYTYQVTGSSNYELDSADAAFKFAEFLSQQKMQVGLNSNRYSNGGGCR